MEHKFFNYDERVEKMSADALEKVKHVFNKIDCVTEYNQQKVLSAFIEYAVSETDMFPSTGYGNSDKGRDKLDKIVARSFSAEDALIRHSFACGTHTLCVMLFGLLRPGDTMLCATGRPYDTICPVIGMDGALGTGSLADFGVNYMQCELKDNGDIDIDAVVKTVKENKIKIVYIQRSRGYTLRPSLSVEKIEEAANAVKAVSDALIVVDNCYGEFVQKDEPVSRGADIMAGSLIKNPGGGLAPCGGYIAGRADLVELCSYRMTTASLGREVGATLGHTRELMMGFFNAPHVVGEALKTAAFAAALFDDFGFGTTPKYDEDRFDIIQAIKLGNKENLIAFCQGIQKGSPVDSYAVPEPWDMPGYPNQVIMAAGAFTNGSSIELSADAPLREPYAVWMQGGLNFHTGKVGIMHAADEMVKKGLI